MTSASFSEGPCPTRKEVGEAPQTKWALSGWLQHL